MMRCDTCKKETAVVQRVVIAEGYNRSLSRPVFNCPECFQKKEASKPYTGSQGRQQQKEEQGGKA